MRMPGIQDHRRNFFLDGRKLGCWILEFSVLGFGFHDFVFCISVVVGFWFGTCKILELANFALDVVLVLWIWRFEL